MKTYKCYECYNNDPCVLTMESCDHKPGACPFISEGFSTQDDSEWHEFPEGCAVPVNEVSGCDALDEAMQVPLDVDPGMKVSTTLKEDKGYA